MKYKKRRFVPGECMHIYQRAVKGFNIFYELEDYLVFFMIFSTVAKSYDVTVMQLCIMVNHVHLLLSSAKLDQVSAFIMHYTSVFAREYNNDIGRHGPLFHKSFGSAPKSGSKSIRSTIVYIGNNPVEKDMCVSADGYKWNFLSYMDRKKRGVRIPLRELSHPLRRAVKVVNGMHSRNAYVTYTQLRQLMSRLSETERDALADHIIMTYYPFDTEALFGFYDSYGDMLTAMRSTAGSEYEIKEMYFPEPDTVYAKMSEVLRTECADMIDGQVKKVLVAKPDDKFHVAQILRQKTRASVYQISRFLHMPIVRAK